MREEGFSLIEALVASMLVIVALASLAQLFVVAMNANQRARSRTLATILAHEKLEELMAIDGDVASGSDFMDARGFRMGSGADPPPGTLYVRQWTAIPLPAESAASVLQVWVTRLHSVSGADAVRVVSVKPTRIPW
jgi:Tfp pilus assembly protein PilV